MIREEKSIDCMPYFQGELASFPICRKVTECSVQNFLNNVASFLGQNLDIFVIDLTRALNKKTTCNQMARPI